MQLIQKKQREMLHLCVFLGLFGQAIGGGLRQAQLESVAVNAAEIKGTQTSELESLREKASKLQAEISDISVDDNSSTVLASEAAKLQAEISEISQSSSTVQSSDDAGASPEVAFKLPEDLQQTPSDDVQLSLLSNSDQYPITQARPVPGLQLTKEAGEPKETEQASVPTKAQFALKELHSHNASTKQGSDKQATMSKSKTSEPEQNPGGFVRPNAGKKPETISFGLFGKNFYGVNLKENSFAIDMVMTLKWVDERVTKLIPDGLDELTLSKKSSEEKLWLPHMAVTNRDIDQYDLISTAVMINKKGEVFKVERFTAVVKNKYKLGDYPYDHQKLIAKIASTKYMIDEVVLQPSKDGNGIADNLLKGSGYEFIDVGASAIKDVDGALKKSRGLLTISIKHDVAKYLQGHMIPCFLLLAVSCGVFYFPFAPPGFITPRVALSTLAMIAFTNLMMNSDDGLPSGAPFNWNDCFNQTIITVMFCNICLNVFSEICNHQLKVESLATHINHECKVLMPFVAILSVGILLANTGPDSTMKLGATSWTVKLILVVFVGGYVAFTLSRIQRALIQKKAEDAAKSVEPVKLAEPMKPMGTNPNLKASA